MVGKHLMTSDNREVFISGEIRRGLGFAFI